MDSIETKILGRIQRRGRGAVTTPGSLLDLGSRQAVDLALHRMVRKGTLRRLGRGLYDYPQTHPQLGPLLPPLEALAKALAGQRQIRIQPTGAYAANRLGLSEQVPAKIEFLTDGPSRKVNLESVEIQLRHTAPRNLAAAGRLSGLVIQALKHFGRDHVTPQHLEHLRRTLPARQRRALTKDLGLAPVWMQPLLRELAREDEADAV